MESVIASYVTNALAEQPDILAHTNRVVNYCKIIGKTEKVNMDILMMSAWLHDICWSNQEINPETIKTHAQESSIMAKEILEKINMSDNVVEKVSSAIASHEQLNENPSNEMRILFEADHLDRLGAIGISRIFSTYGVKAGLEIINKRILPFMETWFVTKKGFDLAREKIHFLNMFADNYNDELIRVQKS
ncbi:MAG: HD domain-containing protein [Nanohaloarchaea archaeon]|nr:HD domain-containing protein [Candidatus Nanohaloarchaea archaeon]